MKKGCLLATISEAIIILGRYECAVTILGAWDWLVYTAIFKKDNQQGPTVQHRELCSILCNNLNGKRIWKRIDTCICLSGASQMVLAIKNPSASAGDLRCGFDPWVRKIPWRRKWQPIPVFLPGESHGQRSLQSIGLQRGRHDWSDLAHMYK